LVDKSKISPILEEEEVIEIEIEAHS